MKKLENENVQEAAKKETPGLKKSVGRKFYDGKISTNINLNDRGSNKETYHIEITTEENVEYEAGDAIAIIPVNKKNYR